MDIRQRISSYWSYRRRSVNRHGVHSPFLFDIIETVLRPKNKAIADIESIREALLANKQSLELVDHGAGTSYSQPSRRVCDVAKRSLSSAEQCGILVRMASKVEAEHILELGTCLGVSAAYMAKSGAKVHSIEGSPELSRIAQQSFAQRFPNIDWHIGRFDERLPELLAQGLHYQLAYIDGDHRAEPTISYYELIQPHMADHGVMIFDDIHWSRDMERAWEELRARPEVTLSVDLYWCGMLFFRKGLSGEHFAVRY